jgi:hypothetical protein
MCICTHHKSFAATGGVVNPDFARRLERERDAERDLADQLGIGLMSTWCLLSTFPEWHLSRHSKKFAKSIATWKEARGE